MSVHADIHVGQYGEFRPEVHGDVFCLGIYAESPWIKDATIFVRQNENPQLFEQLCKMFDIKEAAPGDDTEDGGALGNEPEHASALEAL